MSDYPFYLLAIDAGPLEDTTHALSDVQGECWSESLTPIAIESIVPFAVLRTQNSGSSPVSSNNVFPIRGTETYIAAHAMLDMQVIGNQCPNPTEEISNAWTNRNKGLTEVFSAFRNGAKRSQIRLFISPDRYLFKLFSSCLLLLINATRESSGEILYDDTVSHSCHIIHRVSPVNMCRAIGTSGSVREEIHVIGGWKEGEWSKLVDVGWVKFLVSATHRAEVFGHFLGLIENRRHKPDPSWGREKLLMVMLRVWQWSSDSDQLRARAGVWCLPWCLLQFRSLLFYAESSQSSRVLYNFKLIYHLSVFSNRLSVFIIFKSFWRLSSL